VADFGSIKLHIFIIKKTTTKNKKVSLWWTRGWKLRLSQVSDLEDITDTTRQFRLATNHQRPLLTIYWPLRVAASSILRGRFRVLQNRKVWRYLKGMVIRSCKTKKDDINIENTILKTSGLPFRRTSGDDGQVTCFRQVGGFLLLRFYFSKIKLTAMI
jgi:hypothetical protein